MKILLVFLLLVYNNNNAIRFVEEMRKLILKRYAYKLLLNTCERRILSLQIKLN